MGHTVSFTQTLSAARRRLLIFASFYSLAAAVGERAYEAKQQMAGSLQPTVQVCSLRTDYVP